MTAAEWIAHLEATVLSRQAEQRERATAALTIEFRQPLVQTYRRKRPRKRANGLPLLDQEQPELFR